MIKSLVSSLLISAATLLSLTPVQAQEDIEKLQLVNPNPGCAVESNVFVVTNYSNKTFSYKVYDGNGKFVASYKLSPNYYKEHEVIQDTCASDPYISYDYLPNKKGFQLEYQEVYEDIYYLEVYKSGNSLYVTTSGSH